MAKVHSQVARKDYPEKGIKKGDTYYSWTLRFSRYGAGTTYKSLTFPTKRQLTSNEFKLALYDIEDALDAITIEDVEGGRYGVVSDIENLAGELQNRLDGMPEGLQQGPSGQILQERIDALESWSADLDNIEIPYDASDFDDDEVEDGKEPADDHQTAQDKYDEALIAALEDIQSTSYPG